MYFVCERARQDVKVALIGQGPDELFGGYRRHLGVRYGALVGGLPKWMRSCNFLDNQCAAEKRDPEERRLLAGYPDRMKKVSTRAIAPARQLRSTGCFKMGCCARYGDAILECWEDFGPAKADRRARWFPVPGGAIDAS